MAADLGKPAEGLFVVRSIQFLDPAIYAKYKKITIAGVIIGIIKYIIDEKIIQLPLLSTTAMYLWTQYRSYYSSYSTYNPYSYE